MDGGNNDGAAQQHRFDHRASHRLGQGGERENIRGPQQVGHVIAESEQPCVLLQLQVADASLHLGSQFTVARDEQLRLWVGFHHLREGIDQQQRGLGRVQARGRHYQLPSPWHAEQTASFLRRGCLVQLGEIDAAVNNLGVLQAQHSPSCGVLSLSLAEREAETGHGLDDPFHGQEQQALPRRLEIVEGKCVIRVDDHGHAAKPRGEPAQKTRLGGVGVNEVELFAAEQSEYFQQCPQIPAGTHGRDQGWQGVKNIAGTASARCPWPARMAGQVDFIARAIVEGAGAEGVVLRTAHGRVGD